MLGIFSVDNRMIYQNFYILVLSSWTINSVAGIAYFSDIFNSPVFTGKTVKKEKKWLGVGVGVGGGRAVVQGGRIGVKSPHSSQLLPFGRFKWAQLNLGVRPVLAE